MLIWDETRLMKERKSRLTQVSRRLHLQVQVQKDGKSLQVDVLGEEHGIN